MGSLVCLTAVKVINNTPDDGRGSQRRRKGRAEETTALHLLSLPNLVWPKARLITETSFVLDPAPKYLINYPN